ncbi:MAG: aspartyl/asparaginyl beta-hydroxylase domain-containing protein [Geminicoccaceae bacterium]|nr:aspartyl/asparaginyl beta-hydroxylase domain-containing protein [Geminicoccaceae bacterium]MCB9945514.1 aspartyl/asparaginyl beta-hydroxylase domain-containing protein [Geminicoccaceae bacterium]
MDIGVPLRDLGPVKVGPLVELVNGLSEKDWTEYNFRRDALADKVHSVTDNIVLKTEWHPSATTTGIKHFEDLVWAWATERGLDPTKFLPVAREETDTWPVFTMPDYARYRDIVEPVVEQVVERIKGPRGIVTRIALVRLRGGDKIAPHVDGHLMATRSHRIHVPLSPSQSVTYKIDGRKLEMKLGHAYDFNNRKRHSVRNEGRRHRVNLFIDYCPDRGLFIPDPFSSDAPLYAPRTPVLAA